MSLTSAAASDTRVLSDVLKPRDISEFFSRSAFAKAHAYRAQGRVRDVQVSADGAEIFASVRGSERTPYRVSIHLEFGSGEVVDVDGECSCPIGLNCKHVAATLLEAISGGGAPLEPAHRGSPSNAPPVLAYNVTEWIEKIGAATRGNDYPAELTQRLLYCLGPTRGGDQMPCLDISLLSARVLKDGRFGKQISRPSTYDVAADRAPKYFRDCDIDIVAKLSDQLSGYSYNHHPVPAELLQQVVETGRAFWRDLERPPLRWGEKRTGRIEWRQSSKQHVAPELIVAGTTALNAEPPVYIDIEVGLIGEIETELPPRLAYQLLSAPPIPRSQVQEVSRRLSQRLPSEHHRLLPAMPAAAIKVQETPVPVLRLMLGRTESRNYFFYRDTPQQIPIGHVSFRYGPVEIEMSERANAVEAFQGGQVYAVARQRSKENDAVKHLTDLGFVPARSIYHGLNGNLAQDWTLATPREWLNFLNLHVAQLRAHGFEICIDDSFPYRLAESSGVFDVDFERSGVDWFDLTLGVEIDGERRDLAPLIATLISTPDFTPDLMRQLAEEGEQVYVHLGDGRHVALAANRFLPLVLALHDLKASGAFVNGSQKIKLSRADIVPLLDHETERFAFRGIDSIRHLGRLLQVRGLTVPQLPAGFRAELRPYQAHGVAWLDLLRETGLGGVLADDMGLGKTVQVLALLAVEKARGELDKPALVIAPTSLMTNWFDEARKFAPNLKVLVLQGAGRKQSFSAICDHDVVLSTYPLVVRDHEILLSQDWHMVILDEAQIVKNSNAATSRLLRGIKAKHRFCLTGTPMENHLGELWSIMNFANPGYLGDKAEFARRWRSPIEKHADSARAAELARRIKPFLLRRTKAEVAAELPPKTEVVEHVVLEGSQRDLYDSIRLSMFDKVRKAIQERGLARSHIVVLEALLRLRQVCCDPALLKLDNIERPSAKLDRLMEMLTELSSEGRKIIVFSQFTSMIDLIRLRLNAQRIQYSVLTGKTTDRKRAIEGFQNGASNIFLVSLKAGGVGLNLTAADTVIIFDPWWNPAVEEQAIDRSHRFGQDKPVFVYRLMAEGTIEEKMNELKARKRALADALFKSDGSIGSALTEEDVRALFEE